ncbi:MAG: hypothetical protein PUP91_00325 [Rhizonema sp. PD37]|nr:hypothetical protein [Rhizonema sp. PD37]
MKFLLTSDFQTVATEIASLVFPKTEFQVLFKETGIGKISMTFKNPKHFADNFRIKFCSKLKTLTISGYSKEGIVHLNYLPENNYDWRNGGEHTISKPSSVGEKFEFLASKFYPVLQEYYLGDVFENFFISQEFETAATSVVAEAFPQFHFSLSYSENVEKEPCLNFKGQRNETKILKFKQKTFQTTESILFNVDFRHRAKCLAINTRWDGEQYVLFYNSIGNLSWSTLHSDKINPPSAFGKEFESIAVKLYPLLQEFFPG